MGRVLTNNVAMSYAIETTLGEPSTNWVLLQPNTISTFGAEITTVQREPIDKNRQRDKGVVTDLGSSVEFEHDLTMSVFTDFIEALCFASATNANLDIPVTSVDGTNDAFTVDPVTTDQASKLIFSASEYASLIYARGFFNCNNNGLFVLDADVIDADETADATPIGVTSSLTAETSPPSNAQIQLAGIRFLNGTTDLTQDYSVSACQGGRATLTVGISGFDWGAIGITVGQHIHIGSPDGVGGVQHALQSSNANDYYGIARVISVSGATIALDKLPANMKVGSLTIPATVDILFGKFVRNVPVDDDSYLTRSFQFEVDFQGLGDSGSSEYQYSKGNHCNTMAFNLPITEKATVTYNFIGTDTENPTETRKEGADIAKSPSMKQAFSTSVDIARLRLQDIDEDGLSTDFKSLTLNINNNLSAEKVLGTLGSNFVNTGNFYVEIEAQMLFTHPQVIDHIRDNGTVTFDFVVKNDDGGIVVDIPSLCLNGGAREFTQNETVLINTSGMAHADPTLNTSIGVTIFPVLP